ncbi:hypothetical protein ACFLWM_02600 [Chloroflexota bacterium]
MRHRWLLWASLIVTIGVIGNEISWIGRTELAGVIIAIAVAILLHNIYSLVNR